MNLIEESYREKQEKPKKMMRVIIVFMVLLLIAIFVVIGVLYSIREKPLTSTINGEVNNQFAQMIQYKNDNVYVPIWQVAALLKYGVYKGQYNNASESDTQCYVTYIDGNEQLEAVDLTLGQNLIYKRDITSDDSNYETAELKYAIEAKDGELLINVLDLQEVFNTKYEYDQENNVMRLTTLPYLVSQYSKIALDKGYELEESYVNQKMILDGMMAVVSTSSKNVGIIDTEGNQLIEVKYSSLKYMPEIGDCIVSDNKGKYGVVSPRANKKTKIDVAYDGIDLVNKETGLYVVQQEKRYGIVNSNGEIKVPVDYDQIGIDISKFPENNIKNKYILIDNLIPVKKDKKWALSDKNGNKVTEFEFDGFGYTARSNKNAINLLEIPEYEVMVVCKDDKYGFINKQGQIINEYGIAFDDIYMIRDGGVYKYRASFNGTEYEVEKLLADVDVKVNSPSPTQNVTTNVQEQQTTEEQQVDSNQQQPADAQQADPNQQQPAQEQQPSQEQQVDPNQQQSV